MMRMEYTTCQFEAKAASAGVITGLGSHFHNVDSGRDVILPGAFEKTISEKMPTMLWQHDHTLVPGVWNKAAEVKAGLELEGEFAMKTQLGNDTYELTKMKAVKGLSIGFMIPEGGAEYKDDGIRVISEIDLWEVSVVTFPMNELAQITSVKSKLCRGEKVTERELEMILRDAGFSRVAATLITERGYGALRKDRDDLAIDEVLTAIDNTREVLNNG